MKTTLSLCRKGDVPPFQQKMHANLPLGKLTVSFSESSTAFDEIELYFGIGLSGVRINNKKINGILRFY